MSARIGYLLAAGLALALAWMVLLVAPDASGPVAAAGLPAAARQVDGLLDFEDQLLPDAHGWYHIVNDHGTHAVVPGTAPGGMGSWVLEIYGLDSFGWFADLSGTVRLEADWVYDVDMRCLEGCGSEADMVIARVAAGNGGYLLYPGESDWHNLRLDMDHGANLITAYIDGSLVDQFPPGGSAYAPWFTSTNAAGFLYANTSQYKRAQFDNVYFAWVDFTAWPTAGVAPLEVTFSNLSSLEYTHGAWTFGDGVTGTVWSPTHTYTIPGVYTVTLAVSGALGTDAYTRTSYVWVAEPFRTFLPLVARQSR